jgi:hypothetical protein
MVLAPSTSYLTSKAGPLPIWGWMGLGLGGALGYALYKNHKATAAANGAGDLAGTPGYTLPSNIQPQNTSINEVDYSQVIQASDRQHPPFGGRPRGRGSESPGSHDHDGPPAPDGTCITTDGGPHSTLDSICGSLFGGDKGTRQNYINMIRQDPRNADAIGHMDRKGHLPPGMSLWIPDRPGGGNNQPGGGQRPGDHGQGDGRRGGPSTGPGPMPISNQPGRGGQQHGGGGYGSGGQRSNTYGGR